MRTPRKPRGRGATKSGVSLGIPGMRCGLRKRGILGSRLLPWQSPTPGAPPPGPPGAEPFLPFTPSDSVDHGGRPGAPGRERIVEIDQERAIPGEVDPAL